MPVLTLPDPLAAVCAFLKAQSTVANLLAQDPQTGPKVFRPDLPKAQDEHMPQACIVVRPAGGYSQFGGETFYVADPRVDAICFGGTQLEATNIARALATVVKQLTFPEVWEDTLLYSGAVIGGPLPLPDQQTLWPACWVGTRIMHGELPAS